MGERIAVGDKLPFFVYDTPYSAQNRFRYLLQRKSPLVLVFMANFGHPITRTFASRYANTYGSLRDGGFALVVRSRADKRIKSRADRQGKGLPLAARAKTLRQSAGSVATRHSPSSSPC